MAKLEQARSGGSYLRLDDGSLRRRTPEEEMSGRLTFSEAVDKLLSEDRFSATAVIERLKEAVGAETDAAFAWLTGISQQSLWNRKKRNSVPYREAVFIAAWSNCSLEYLITGEGSLQEEAQSSPEP